MKNHKNIICGFLLLSCALLFACGTAESVGDDAAETPIGSVLSGKTSTTDSYIKRVSEDNKRLDRETWRPQSADRF